MWCPHRSRRWRASGPVRRPGLQPRLARRQGLQPRRPIVDCVLDDAIAIVAGSPIMVEGDVDDALRRNHHRRRSGRSAARAASRGGGHDGGVRRAASCSAAPASTPAACRRRRSWRARMPRISRAALPTSASSCPLPAHRHAARQGARRRGDAERAHRRRAFAARAEELHGVPGTGGVRVVPTPCASADDLLTAPRIFINVGGRAQRARPARRSTASAI